MRLRDTSFELLSLLLAPKLEKLKRSLQFFPTEKLPKSQVTCSGEKLVETSFPSFPAQIRTVPRKRTSHSRKLPPECHPTCPHTGQRREKKTPRPLEPDLHRCPRSAPVLHPGPPQPLLERRLNGGARGGSMRRRRRCHGVAGRRRRWSGRRRRHLLGPSSSPPGRRPPPELVPVLRRLASPPFYPAPDEPTPPRRRGFARSVLLGSAPPRLVVMCRPAAPPHRGCCRRSRAPQPRRLAPPRAAADGRSAAAGELLSTGLD